MIPHVTTRLQMSKSISVVCDEDDEPLFDIFCRDRIHVRGGKFRHHHGLNYRIHSAKYTDASLVMIRFTGTFFLSSLMK